MAALGFAKLSSDISRSGRRRALSTARKCTVRAALFAALVAIAPVVPTAAAFAAEDSEQQLRHADDIKTANNSAFVDLVHRLAENSAALSAQQRIYLRYLQAWQLGYTGEFEAAVEELKAVIAESTDPTVKFRARVSLVNDQALVAHYEEAYAGLSELLETRSQVTDKDARMLGFGVASLLYNQAGQYDLGLAYAEHWLAEEGDGHGICKASYLKLDSLFRSGKLALDDPQVAQAIDACQRVGEPLYANLIRTFIANIEIARGSPGEAAKLLTENDASVQQTHSARLASEFHSILARCYLLMGQSVKARQYAHSAIDKAIKKEFSKPLADAYGVLYEAAKRDGDMTNALAFHEKFAEADKGYLNDTTARTIAFQMVNQQVLDKKRQIDVLNEKNQVLKLQGEVAAKAAETERLYLTILILGLLFIVLWAWRTKLSQVRFQKLARRDGLTGILNRQHFMDEAKVGLQYCAKSHREAAMILIDLDNFKTINDTYGHIPGDGVLKQTVAACQDQMRSIDLFGRLGGEEFGVLLPDCGVEIAASRAEDLRAAIARIVSPGIETTISASFGVTSTRASGYDLRQMLIHADSALYSAKHAGRNRVESFPADGGTHAASGPQVPA